MWNQIYNPLDSTVLSTIAAAIPVITLLVLIASGKVKAHIAAIIALIVTNLITIAIFHMPADMSVRASLLGVVTGFFPIGWIVLNVIFLYQITVATGRFELLKRAVGGVTEDRRLQLLLIAFSFGAFFEGASGFGTPVAITGAVLIGLGFSPLAASGLSLIANTAPVAYGALGTPIQGLASVTGLDPYMLGAMVGRQLPFFSVIVPFWVVWAFAGWKGMKDVWPAILVTGISFADPAIRDLELHQPVDRRHRRLADLDGLPDPVPEGMAAEGSSGCRRRCAGTTSRHRDHGGGEAAGQDAADPGAALERAAAVDHRLHRDADLGQRRLQDLGELDLHLELSGARTAQYDQQDAAGGGRSRRRKARCSPSPICPSPAPAC